MIRDATHDDIPVMVEMGKRFADAARLEQIAGVDEASLRFTLQHLIDSDNGILLTGEGCVAGGMVVPAYWNAHHLTGQELFWWVDPEHRGVGVLLLDALENTAREMGAKSWGMITLDAIRPKATGRLYERRGYRLTEHAYVKVF